MDLKQLAAKVKATRDAQKKYFKERTPSALNNSKALEKDLDTTVSLILLETPQQKIF